MAKKWENIKHKLTSGERVSMAQLAGYVNELSDALNSLKLAAGDSIGIVRTRVTVLEENYDRLQEEVDTLGESLQELAEDAQKAEEVRHVEDRSDVVGGFATFERVLAGTTGLAFYPPGRFDLLPEGCVGIIVDKTCERHVLDAVYIDEYYYSAVEVRDNMGIAPHEPLFDYELVAVFDRETWRKTILVGTSHIVDHLQ